jgi:hypothetical protein
LIALVDAFIIFHLLAFFRAFCSVLCPLDSNNVVSSAKAEIVMEMIDLCEVVAKETALEMLKEGPFDLYTIAGDEPETRELIAPLFEAGILEDVAALPFLILTTTEASKR